MIEIVSYISEWALVVIRKTGYAGIFLLSALESAAIPIPSEVVIPFSGFLAVSGRFNIWLIVLTATLANLAGSIILIFGTMKSQKEINTETKPGIPIVKSAIIRKFLLKSRSISMIGLIVITAGFLIQLIAILFDLYI